MPRLTQNIRNTICLFTCFALTLTLTRLSLAGELPPLSQWTERGEVLGSPGSGKWDSFGWGNNKVHSVADAPTIDAMVKKNGVYYLYYTGSSGARSDDGYAANRKIGVATSTDGVNFSRYSGNPVMTYSSSNHNLNPEEEGAEYCKVALDDNGNFVMYYAACKAASSIEVDCAIRWATSNNGFNFTDQGVVPSLDVSENWPAGVLRAQGGTASLQGSWHLWFNTDRRGKYEVWLASGNSPGNLTIQPNNPVLERFGAAPTLHPDGNTVTILVQPPDKSEWTIVARDTTLNQLNTYSSSYLETGYGEGLGIASILVDKENGMYRWYYMHPTARTFHLRTVPLPDSTPPATPTNLVVE